MPVEPRRRAPLLAPCVFVCAGIALSRWARIEPRECLVAAAALGILTLAAGLLRDGRALRMGLSALVLAAGAGLEAGRRPGVPPALNAGPRKSLVAEGCVVEPPVWFAQAQTPEGDDPVRFTLELAPRARARVNIYLRPGEAAPDLRYGQRIEFTARFRPIRNYENPGAFDAAAYFARRQVYWNASVTGAHGVRVVAGGCGTAWRAWTFALRGNLLRRIEVLFGPGTPAAGTLRAMLLGDATWLDENDAESYRRAGVYHVLVVSGLHVAVIGAVLLFLLRVLHCGVTATLAWTAAIAWLYAILCGGAAPVVRAAAGMTLFALGRWFYRRPQVLNILAAVVLAYLVADPGQLFEASFQLSFLAVALIGGLAAPLLNATFGPVAAALRRLRSTNDDFRHGPRLAEWRVELRLLSEAAAVLTRIPAQWCLGAFAICGRLAAWAGEATLVAVIVQLGMALPMVTYFHRFPIAGLSANLTVAPLMTAAVPLGLAATVAESPLLAAPVAWAVESSQAIVNWHARLERDLGGAASRIPEPPLWLGVAFVLTLIALSLAVATRGKLPRAALAIAFAVALALVLLHPFAPRWKLGKLELTAIDVGQGDSLLAVSPAGGTLLIDTGGLSSFGRDRAPTFDIGEEVVSPYLWSRSIRHLDVIAVTHPDADHVGGVRALLENFRPRELWMGAELPAETLALAARLGVAIRRPRAGEGFDWDGVAIDVLGPPAGSTSGKINNRSLVLRLAFGRHSFLLTGDIERGAEYGLLNAGGPGQVTVLKVAHHGSRTSTVPEFLAAARPAVAVVSVGRDNTYGHPHPDVLARLHQDHRRVLRTDQSGLISIWTDGRYLETETRLW